MGKKFESTERFLKPDPRFNSRLVSKFINCLMHAGKKTQAERVFYDAMEIIHDRLEGEDPLDVFTTCITNIRPMVEVRSKRVGGANYQVPVEVNKKRQQALAFRWLLDAVRDRKGKPTHIRLAEEVLHAYRREGKAMETRENVHRMAEANKAFAHFAW